MEQEVKIWEKTGFATLDGNIKMLISGGYVISSVAVTETQNYSGIYRATKAIIVCWKQPKK